MRSITGGWRTQKLDEQGPVEGEDRRGFGCHALTTRVRSGTNRAGSPKTAARGVDPEDHVVTDGDADRFLELALVTMNGAVAGSPEWKMYSPHW